MSRRLQKQETLLGRQTWKKNFSDEPTIPEQRNITELTIGRKKFHLLIVTETRNIMERELLDNKF